jgi:hypothetical protein
MSMQMPGVTSVPQDQVCAALIWSCFCDLTLQVGDVVTHDRDKLPTFVGRVVEDCHGAGPYRDLVEVGVLYSHSGIGRTLRKPGLRGQLSNSINETRRLDLCS